MILYIKLFIKFTIITLKIQFLIQDNIRELTLATYELNKCGMSIMPYAENVMKNVKCFAEIENGLVQI